MNNLPSPNVGNQGLISLTSDYALSMADLKTPSVIINIAQELKVLVPRKRKINFNDFYLLLSGSPQGFDITPNLTEAILSANEVVAAELWNTFAVDIKNALITPDYGTINIDIIKKMDVPGQEIRNAYLSKWSIAPPVQTAYAYIYGDTSSDAAAELVMVLNQLKKLKPEGAMLIREFFEEIDTRILYLFGMSEAEQFAEDDCRGGAFLQLAMDMNDKIPEEVPLLSWLQENVPDVFNQVRSELLNPIWQENRSMFWMGWMRLNRPEVGEDHYDKKRGTQQMHNAEYVNTEDLLDDLINRSENSD